MGEDGIKIPNKCSKYFDKQKWVIICCRQLHYNLFVIDNIKQYKTVKKNYQKYLNQITESQKIFDFRSKKRE